MKAMLSWCIEERWRLGDVMLWSHSERNRFLRLHRLWPKERYTYAKEHYALVAKEAMKWVDDCALFIFGYLVPRFWTGVLQHGKIEEEMWVTSILPTINVMRPAKVANFAATTKESGDV